MLSTSGSATLAAAPVIPSRIRSPTSDCGDPAKLLIRLFQLSDGSQSGGGSWNVRPSVLTSVAAIAPGTKPILERRRWFQLSFDPQE